MYRIGDKVLYGNTGVCVISDITARKLDKEDHEQLFYVLEPLYSNCTIFTPVNAEKVFMRPIISKKEADRLIDTIPTIQAEAYHNRVIRQLVDHYDSVLKTYDCTDLIELTMSIYAKKQYVEQQKRKFGAVDARYMKQAEELLFGELAAALDIPKEEVPEYIEKKISKYRNASGDKAQQEE